MQRKAAERNFKRQPITQQEKLQALDRATLAEEAEVRAGRRSSQDLTLRALNALRQELVLTIS